MRNEIPTEATAPLSLLTDKDLYLFNEGTHTRLYNVLGAHTFSGGRKGTVFAVWAPDAYYVSVIGDFNHWNDQAHPMVQRGRSGIWETFVPEARKEMLYKFHIRSHHNDYRVNKSDPFGFQHEAPPLTASVISDLLYKWHDDAWMRVRAEKNGAKAPWSVYEVHLGSWRRVPEENNRPLTYRELAEQLPRYVKEMGFTHVEFLPVTEHPFYGSWGYQTTGYFAPTSRQGSPTDFMYLIDVLHQNGIGVVLDWVASHFPTDEHGLGFFDGSHLFEHADPQKGFHPDWKSFIFNYGRNEVKAFLISSATFWLDKYHVDGLRVDGVASMLYLDYSREPGRWVSNKYGGNENLEAIEFLRALNRDVSKFAPATMTIAEESTAWPGVSRPVENGGLGFGMKWDMGWMHDTLLYMSKDPLFRRHHHDMITFRNLYAFSENFMLPLSHDEVVYGKGSLLNKMPGDEWQKFANLRALFGMMTAQPAKKLLFMGAEFGQWQEWSHERSLDWHLLLAPLHRGVQKWIADLNQLYRAERSLYELDFSPRGFEWNKNAAEESVMAFTRRGATSSDLMTIVFNLTPVVRYDFKIGVRRGGAWSETLNSDQLIYGGSGVTNGLSINAQSGETDNFPYFLSLTLPPLSAMFLKSEGFEF